MDFSENRRNNKEIIDSIKETSKHLEDVIIEHNSRLELLTYKVDFLMRGYYWLIGLSLGSLLMSVFNHVLTK
jgi:hypothetical protein